MENDEIKAGDVVSLKSDENFDILMTVEEVNNKEAECIWFDRQYNFVGKQISVSALKKKK